MKVRYIILGVMMFALCAAGDVAKDLTVCEGFVNPIGLHDATPTFSWKLPQGVKKQAAYRIEVRDGQVVWDSGWVESGQSVFVPYGGPALNSRQRLSWRVDFKDETGKASGWSNPAAFELGLLETGDWKARWIHHAGQEADPVPQFDLINAVYRSTENPELHKDVTFLCREKIKDHTLNIRVSNKELGGDPAPGTVKELVLTYRLDGIEKTGVVEEDKRAVFPSIPPAEEKVAFLRREFSVSGDVVRARLYVTARGLYQLSLNGRKVGDDAFAPGWTPYANRIETRTYDVTGLLKKDANALGALLGTGWYTGALSWDKVQNIYGRTPELLVQLEIEYQDGKRQMVVSDGDWKATLGGPIRSSSIYDGEVYDARMEMPGWNKVGFDDMSWDDVIAVSDLGPASLTPKAFAPVRVTGEVPAVEITEPVPDRFIFNLGQNMVGWVRINVPVVKGQPISIRFAEMLNLDGTLHTDNYRKAKSTDTYIPAETGVIEWQPVFTFHGFQYVELSGLPEGVRPQMNWVKGLVLHSDLEKTGTFKSSHKTLNRLQQNIIWGQRGNFLDIPTDCPQRDERLGWTGDAQVFCPTAMFNYDCLAFFKSWLTSMRHEQFDDGRIPHVIPDIRKKAGSPGWMDAATFIPWEVYVRTGDAEVLAENYEMMERLVAWYRSQSADHLISEIGGFGDWLQPYADATRGDTPRPLLGSAFYARSTQILADSAKVLGKTEDAEKYAREAAAIRKAFGERYFDADGKLQTAPETQTAYILALQFGLVPAGMEAKAAVHLVELINKADGHLRTGFLGTPYIAPVLDRAGYPDLALELLFKETYPSWFYSISQGATTMWERWNSYTKADGFSGDGMNSLNHYAYGAIGQWMYERLAGLAPDPDYPGYKHFFIRPLIAPQLDHARAELETPYGKAAGGWMREDGKVVIEAVVPPNTTATVIFPDSRKSETIGAGTYRFELGERQ